MATLTDQEIIDSFEKLPGLNLGPMETANLILDGMEQFGISAQRIAELVPNVSLDAIQFGLLLADRELPEELDIPASHSPNLTDQQLTDTVSQLGNFGLDETGTSNLVLNMMEKFGIPASRITQLTNISDEDINKGLQLTNRSLPSQLEIPLSANLPDIAADPGVGFGIEPAQNALLSGGLLGLQQIGRTQQQVSDLFGTARKDISGGAESALSSIGQTREQIGGLFARGEEALTGGTERGLAQLDQTQGRVGEIFDQATGEFDPFIDPGQQAAQQQAALSGALGPEAQAAAFQAFRDSPGQAFLREQGELSVVRNAAKIGGLGGGNVRRELTKFGTGLAAQDFGNQFSRLGEVAERGVGAAGSAGQLLGQQGNIESILGQLMAQLPPREAEALANLLGQQGGIQGQLGQFEAGIPIGEAGSLSGLQGQQAGIQGQLGLAASSVPLSISQLIAQNRVQAGRDIAGNIEGTTSALADLVNQQGAGLTDIVGTGSNNVLQLLQQFFQGSALSQENLGTNLSNLGSNQATQLGTLPSTQFQTTNTLGNLGQVAGGVGGIISGLNQTQQPVQTGIQPLGTFGQVGTPINPINTVGLA